MGQKAVGMYVYKHTLGHHIAFLLSLYSYTKLVLVLNN